MKYKIIIFLLFFCSLLKAQNISLDNKFRLAQSYEEAGMLDKAKEIYADIYKAAPNNYVYFESYNRLLLTLKDYDTAINILTERIKLNPNDINNYGLLGTIYYLQNKQDEAFATWEEAIKIMPTNSSIYRIIANFAVQNRAFDKAIEYLQKGAELSTDKINFYFEIANLLTITMKYSQAADEYCKILLSQPNQLEGIKARIAPYLNTKESINLFLETVKKFTIENKDKAVFYEFLTFLYLQNDDYSNAYNNVLLADKLYNTDGAKIYAFANAALNENNYEFAAKAFDYIIKNYNNSAFVPNSKIAFVRTKYNALNNKYLLINPNWKEFSAIDTTGSYEYIPIIKTYLTLVKDYSGNPDIKTEAFYYIGEIYKEKFNLSDSAKKYLTEIADRYPISAFAGKALFKLSEIAINEGNLTQADAFLDKILLYRRVSSGELKEAEYMKAKITFWQNDFDKTISKLNGVIKELNENIANDALNLLITINTLKNDSLSLVKYAMADYLANRGIFNEAAKIYSSLSNSNDVIFLNNLALYNYSLMLIALNDYKNAIIYLENLSNNENMNIFADKSLFLLANLYQYGLKDLEKAKFCYQKILEKYPNSFYIEKARNFLNN